MPKTYLLSRTLDPLLGVFTGFLAYYLHETNPRTAPPPGHTLRDLIAWQWEQRKERNAVHEAATAAADQAELEIVRRELEAAGAVHHVDAMLGPGEAPAGVPKPHGKPVHMPPSKPASVDRAV